MESPEELLAGELNGVVPAEVRSLMVKYRSRLTIEQLSAGVKACLSNARALVFDAEVLGRNGRYARAMSLAMTAMEEIG